jgi:hypothetical protein
MAFRQQPSGAMGAGQSNPAPSTPCHVACDRSWLSGPACHRGYLVCRDALVVGTFIRLPRTHLRPSPHRVLSKRHKWLVYDGVRDRWQGTRGNVAGTQRGCGATRDGRGRAGWMHGVAVSSRKEERSCSSWLVTRISMRDTSCLRSKRSQTSEVEGPNRSVRSFEAPSPGSVATGLCLCRCRRMELRYRPGWCCRAALSYPGPWSRCRSSRWRTR